MEKVGCRWYFNWECNVLAGVKDIFYMEAGEFFSFFSW